MPKATGSPYWDLWFVLPQNGCSGTFRCSARPCRFRGTFCRPRAGLLTRSTTVLRTNTNRAARVAALATAGLLALSACGDSDKDATSTDDTGNKATGTPILVGFINDDTGP